MTKKTVAKKMKPLKKADYYQVSDKSGHMLGYTSNMHAHKNASTKEGWKGKDLIYKTMHKK